MGALGPRAGQGLREAADTGAPSRVLGQDRTRSQGPSSLSTRFEAWRGRGDRRSLAGGGQQPGWARLNLSRRFCRDSVARPRDSSRLNPLASEDEIRTLLLPKSNSWRSAIRERCGNLLKLCALAGRVDYSQ